MYGLLISLGALLAFFISEKAAKKRNLNLHIFYRTVNFALILGVIGARLYHVIDYWTLYKQNPLLIVKIWKGGLGIFGAMLGGLVGTYISAVALNKEKDSQLLQWLDIGVLGLPLAQAVGRWGNFFNKEIYGLKTNLPWAITVRGEKYHPLFLYESLLNLALFTLLIKIEKTKKDLKEGTIFFTYLTGYGTIRFFLEFLRIRSWNIWGFNIAQIISVLMVLAGIFNLFRKNLEKLFSN